MTVLKQETLEHVFVHASKKNLHVGEHLKDYKHGTDTYLIIDIERHDEVL